MIHGVVIIFLVFAALFALVHTFAVTASLYWYHWWFDILMHFWGGTLIGLGVHAFSTIPWFSYRPTTKVVLLVLAAATISWEVFERLVGLYDPLRYLLDTGQDMVLGFSGGLLTHLALQAYRMK